MRIRPLLRDELLAHRARVAGAGPRSYVFSTSAGKRQNPSNVRRRVLDCALERANENRARAGEPPLPVLTPHGLRRSFASLLYAIGESPPVVMAEMGHTDPALALAIYAQAMRRNEGEDQALQALVNGPQWAREREAGLNVAAAGRPSERQETAD